jgi:hypothetical protein
MHAGLATRFSMAVKPRVFGIISAEFVTKELAAGIAPSLQLSVHDC